MQFIEMFKRALGFAPKVHPVERGMARHWTRQRLIAVFPELRTDPRRLDAAYRALSLEPVPSETNPAELVFEVALHRDLEN